MSWSKQAPFTPLIWHVGGDSAKRTAAARDVDGWEKRACQGVKEIDRWYMPCCVVEGWIIMIRIPAVPRSNSSETVGGKVEHSTALTLSGKAQYHLRTTLRLSMLSFFDTTLQLICTLAATTRHVISPRLALYSEPLRRQERSPVMSSNAQSLSRIDELLNGWVRCARGSRKKSSLPQPENGRF